MKHFIFLSLVWRAKYQINLKNLDEQLQRHLSRAWTMEKNNSNNSNKQGGGEAERERVPIKQDWEINTSKLIIKNVIARGTFGIVHRGVYDGLDRALHDQSDWISVSVLMLLQGHMTDAEIAALRVAFTQEVDVWHKLDHPSMTKVRS
ncbi:hypothetical protein LguiA_018053 [Lonicera macranthoides]